MGANQPNSTIPTSNLQLLSARDYNIPIYQRPYCWTRENIERLLNDIEAARLKNSAASYYIGNVITSAPLNNEGTISDWGYNFDILDGQQRFTTLTMIAAFLELDDVMQTDGNHRLTLQPDQEESAAFESLLKEKLNNKFTLPGLPQAFKEAAEVIANWFNNPKINIELFKKYLQSNVKFFEINLSDLIGDKVNKTIATINYYDNLNTSGKQLEPFDVFKGLLFAKLKNTDLAAGIWNKAFNQVSGLLSSGGKTTLASHRFTISFCQYSYCNNQHTNKH